MANDDVFLSFRGGTRYRFTDHLYHALRRNGIDTFRDNENLRVGDELRPVLMNAIENCKMAIVVLCENYASSTWCLDELVKIVDCHEKQGKQVLPIIYRMKPSDVWEQKGSYETAMAKHEDRYGKDSEKVKAWRLALSKVDTLKLIKWLHCTEITYEPEFIKNIVRDTADRLPLPEPTQHVVGLDTCCEQVKSVLNIESNENICMLGIYGPGGIGKTTLARCLFDKIKRQFEASCFLGNVREKSESRGSLESLQKTVLYDMGEETITDLGSEFKGGYEIKRRLRHKRVLLVLDDVNSITQLESLAGGHDWFGSGSRIIITTRDTDVVDKHVMGDVVTKKYKMEELNDDDSLELFSWHAFNRKEPAENFKNVSRNAISYAKGFPLALEVIGSHLGGFTSVDSWEEELHKYRIDPSIQGVLEISYNSLYELDQKTFLDIACFFKGEKWDYVKRVLKACDFYPIVRVFISKCLITVNQSGCLDMHDLVQDMGKEIVMNESPTNPGERSRLWSHKDILQVLKDDTGSSSIEGIMLHPSTLEEVNYWINTAFDKMEKLRILIVRNTVFSTAPSHLPNSLRLLEWKGYPSESFPLDFHPHRIVDLKLPHSALKLERLFQVFEDLTFINLSQCQSVTHVPDMSGAKSLRVLTLDKCNKLVGFDESIGFMPNLVYLSASECSKLKHFVPEMYLPSLEVLSFYFCKSLQSFPEIMQEMDKPLKINLVNSAIEEFPNSIGNLTGLEHIDISKSKRLQYLPDEDLHPILHIHQKLEGINVSNNCFSSLPKCIEGFLHLKILDVSYCNNLMIIPELPSSIQKVDARYCLSLTPQSSTMPLSKILQETKRIEVVMPKKEIPNWLDYNCSKDIPLFWARRKFPVVALAFMFGRATGSDIDETLMKALDFWPQIASSKSYTVGLNLFIEGQQIFPEKSKYFNVGEDHVLLFDLRTLFSDKEWHDLDSYIGDDWKAIHVVCESTLTLNHWGVYVYKGETNMDDIYFKHLPNHKLSSELVLERSPQQTRQRIGQVIDNLNPTETFDNEHLSLVDLEEDRMSFTKALVRSYKMAKANEASSSSNYGASLKKESEESNWDVLRLIELMKENVPKDIADSNPGQIQAVQEFAEEFFKARAQFMMEKDCDMLNIGMMIALEEYHIFGPPTRRYWGRIDLKHADDPTFKAVMRRAFQESWRIEERAKAHNRRMIPILLLKCEIPSIWGESSQKEEYGDDPVLEELLSKIEKDAMDCNKSYGKLKASITYTNELLAVSDEYLLEATYLRAHENMENEVMSEWGRLELALCDMFRSRMRRSLFGWRKGLMIPGASTKKTSYGTIRVALEDQDTHDNNRMQHNKLWRIQIPRYFRRSFFLFFYFLLRFLYSGFLFFVRALSFTFCFTLLVLLVLLRSFMFVFVFLFTFIIMVFFMHFHLILLCLVLYFIFYCLRYLFLEIWSVVLGMV
ncbi:TMV resistance protein N-like isoform X2 [Arachis ipaensis]|uniref:TMV resistance protein N-like isoform X2 n=1 Tax=Arachis ipaensis TaxID=130454 RepID=UPI000A2B9670|nr:TMV resistance protein N-like isoform X2 [Arachis ipaensis]